MVPLLALCLVLPIAASAQAPEFSGVNEFPIVKDKIELKVFARLDSNIADPATNVWTKHQERLTNVHIVWETVPNAAQNEKVNLLLASSNRPDIFFGVSGALSPTVQMVHGPTGTFVDLKPLIDEHGYWIKKMFEQVPYIEAAITAPDRPSIRCRRSMSASTAITRRKCGSTARGWISWAWKCPPRRRSSSRY